MEAMVADPTFWKGRRVLLTGHSGFKGGWLALWLERLGANVTGYALPPPTQPSLFEAAGIAAGLDNRFGDLRQLDALQAAFAQSRPEIVLHLAAQALVQRSYVDPVETYSSNVMGTVHLLEAVRHSKGVRAVVVVTSDKCYDNREWIWPYRESDPMGGHDPYSSSKGCAELISAAWRDSYFPPAAHDRHGVALATARAGNVLGGGDWAAQRLVPDAVRAFTAGQPLVVRNPGAVRPWQHVLEPIAGYMLLAQRLVQEGPGFAGSWNFGPAETDARPVSWVVDRLVALWGGSARWERDAAHYPPEAFQLRLDSSKARALLGWRPRWQLEQGLEAAVAWYKAFQERRAMREFTLAQIAAYEEASPS